MSKEADFTLKLHTIIITVGPSHCGKTYFATKLADKLRAQLSEKQIEPNVQYVSSDQLRKQLLNNESMPKNTPAMTQISHHTFQLLYTYVKTVTSYPITAHFVIVDTTGLNAAFISDITAIAKESYYYLDVFIFKYKYADYFKYGGDKSLIKKHIDTLQKDIMKIFWAKDSKYSPRQIHLIKKPGQEFSCPIAQLDMYKETILTPNKQYIVVANVGSHLNEFVDLLTRCGCTVTAGLISPPTIPTIPTIPAILTDIIYIDEQIHDDMIDFLTHNLLHSKVQIHLVCLKSGNLAVKPFVKYQSDNYRTRSFIVTPTACDYKYLDKFDVKYTDTVTADNIYTDTYHYPVHIFGGYPIKDVYYGSTDNNNLLIIDTGCIYGNKLSAVICGHDIYRPKVYSVESKCTDIQRALANFHLNRTSGSEPEPDMYAKLTKEQIRRIKFLSQQKINYLANTISPADTDGTDLESLKMGLTYYYDLFRSRSIKMRLSIQPKYMGSRCYVYLFRNIDECYMVSRNGYVVSQLSLEVRRGIYQQLLHKLDKYMIDNESRMMIIDGELMPWNALGNKLINNGFRVTDVALREEIQLLKDTGFEPSYTNLITTPSFSSYTEERTDNQDLYKKYGATTYLTYKELTYERTGHQTLAEMESMSAKYHSQLELYAADGPAHIKPFSILKVIKTDGTEIVTDGDHGDQITLFQLVSDDEQCICDFDADDFETNYQRAHTFFKKLTTEHHLEGVVIKPNIYVPDCAPQLKVRNPHYLTIIYGPDYLKPNKYARLISQKNIKTKIKLSISQHQLGLALLRIKYDDISCQNAEYVGLLIKFLFAEDKEKQTDPRL